MYVYMYSTVQKLFTTLSRDEKLLWLVIEVVLYYYICGIKKLHVESDLNLFIIIHFFKASKESFIF